MKHRFRASRHVEVRSIVDIVIVGVLQTSAIYRQGPFFANLAKAGPSSSCCVFN